MHIVIFGLDEDVKLLIEAYKKEQVYTKWTVINTELSKPQDESFLKKHNIRTSPSIQEIEDFDILFNNTENESALADERKSIEDKVVIPEIIYKIMIKQIKRADKNRMIPIDMNELILERIHDGMIIVDKNEHIQFVNERAKEIVHIQTKDVVGQHIQSIIPKTRLPLIMQKGNKEVNMQLELENGNKIITTRIPMYNDEEEMIGAFAVFKDITEVVHLAEENTDLNQVKMMLEAIIFSSLDAISVVDTDGKGLMINPAYTKVTGLTKEEVIGKPATTDIYEGRSVHDYVLTTGENVRNATMKVGVLKKDVIVNAAPIIVDGQTVGSVAVIHDLSELQTVTDQLHKAHKKIRALQAKYTFNDIIGQSTEMTIAREQAKIGARTPAAVLLRGESGSGKELFAHAIHNESDRRLNPFIRINCATIDPNLIEGELFGYAEESFSSGSPGFIEDANNGSIFLDEISELSSTVQMKILRVLKEKEVLRIGGLQPISVDVRILAATNKQLEREVARGNFSEDLYYHLSRLPIFIPSLRERVSDITDITTHLIQKLNIEYSRDVESITEDAIDFLKQLPWHGNIRELENRIGRAMIYMEGDEHIIKEHHIKEGWMPSVQPIVDQGYTKDLLKDAVDDFEKEFITRIYRTNNFVKTKTAQVLGISLRSLYNKLERFEIT